MPLRDYLTTFGRTGLRLVVSASALAAVGCGDSRLVPVSGVLTLDGKGVPRMVVFFRPAPGNPADPQFCPSSHGVTDENGHFEMETFDSRGAIPGEHIVTVAPKPPDGRENEDRAEEESANQQPEFELPARASDGTIRFTVPKDGTQEAHFAFSSSERRTSATRQRKR